MSKQCEVPQCESLAVTGERFCMRHRRQVLHKLRTGNCTISELWGRQYDDDAFYAYDGPNDVEVGDIMARHLKYELGDHHD